ncbi:TlpA family protein disulfide reductase [Pedobacter gandavensis]|uniref:Redoxin domain-containing protein n=1 Tax=Pedobacter gandavensis TaxID=2679963 RepID=A0ABR6EST1_9SPHI|nr:hypothetical protein [Pedobacter gandavensis]MBB2148324.1 hypothetical protein [Pedobacter gandavensis]
MHKKSIKIILLSFLVILFFGLGFAVYYQTELNKEKTGKDISEMEISRGNDNLKLGDITIKKNLIINFLSTDCLSCTQQLKVIGSSDFANQQILLLSNESSQIMDINLKRKGLINKPNIQYAHVNSVNFYKFFGTLSIPTTIIIDQNYKIKKTYNGFVNTATLMTFLNP